MITGENVKHSPYYLKAWTAVANNTAGAPGGGAGLGVADGGKQTYSDSDPDLIPAALVLPGLELFLGCLGAVYWNDSFP